ncbi:6-phosphofructokinase, partial [Mycolicibacter senuensis]|uniref:6-phosphofructokinase n=1 Tax=Mycolicibacter senuensis TaxID=386913 RepID=UPI000DCC6BC3
MTAGIKRVAINTGGGDAPGLNAVIYAATLAADNRGWEVVGIRDGFNGMLFGDDYPDGGLIELTRNRVRGIIHQGGTILGSTNRGNPIAYPVQQPDGSWIAVDRTDELLGRFAERGIDALITVGGDGSLTIANHLHDAGLPLVGVPKTIDNDLDRTAATFGFDSAVGFASECIDRLFSTATSHSRIIVVEVMGRYAGWIALHAGMASGVHAILIPEIPYRLEPVAELIRERAQRGSTYSMVCVAEGAKPVGGEHTVAARAVGQAERLGGIGQ